MNIENTIEELKINKENILNAIGDCAKTDNTIKAIDEAIIYLEAWKKVIRDIINHKDKEENNWLGCSDPNRRQAYSKSIQTYGTCLDIIDKYLDLESEE